MTTTSRPFRFAVSAATPPDGRDWPDFARQVEASGFDALYVSDHVHQGLAVIPALAAAAVATEDLRIGPFVLAAGLRNPVLLLHELATVDVLSGGRLDIGLGAGWLASDYALTSTPYREASARVDDVVGVAHLLRGAFAAGPHGCEAKYADVRDGLSSLAARSTGPPPILIGAGSHRLLGFAAAEADAISIAPRATADGDLDRADDTAASLDRKVEIVRRRAGHRLASLDLNYLVHHCFVTPRPVRVREAIAGALRCDVEDLASVPSVLVGTSGEVADQLEERRARWGLNLVTVPAEAAEPFAAVVELLRGRS